MATSPPRVRPAPETRHSRMRLARPICANMPAMCGRFTRMYTWRDLWELYTLSPGIPLSNLQPRYNICPTTTIDAVIERNKTKRRSRHKSR